MKRGGTNRFRLENKIDTSGEFFDDESLMGDLSFDDALQYENRALSYYLNIQILFFDDRDDVGYGNPLIVRRVEANTFD